MLTLGVRMLAVHQTFVEGKPVWLLYTRTVSDGFGCGFSSMHLQAMVALRPTRAISLYKNATASDNLLVL